MISIRCIFLLLASAPFVLPHVPVRGDDVPKGEVLHFVFEHSQDLPRHGVRLLGLRSCANTIRRNPQPRGGRPQRPLECDSSWYHDTSTGTTMDRPGLRQLIKDREMRRADALIVRSSRPAVGEPDVRVG